MSSVLPHAAPLLLLFSELLLLSFGAEAALLRAAPSHPLLPRRVAPWRSIARAYKVRYDDGYDDGFGNTNILPEHIQRLSEDVDPFAIYEEPAAALAAAPTKVAKALPAATRPEPEPEPEQPMPRSCSLEQAEKELAELVAQQEAVDSAVTQADSVVELAKLSRAKAYKEQREHNERRAAAQAQRDACFAAAQKRREAGKPADKQKKRAELLAEQRRIQDELRALGVP